MANSTKINVTASIPYDFSQFKKNNFLSRSWSIYYLKGFSFGVKP